MEFLHSFLRRHFTGKPVMKSQNVRCFLRLLVESFRFSDECDYEYKIFSILSIAQASTNVILAGKRDSLRHSITSFSENVVVAGTSYQM